MNKGLKALKRITSNSTCYVSQDYDLTNYDFDIRVIKDYLKVVSILTPLVEVVETPEIKKRYLKINGVVVYTFKTKEEYLLFKEVFDYD